MIARIVAVATATKKALMQNKKEKQKRSIPITCISGKKKPHTVEELQKEGDFKGIINKLL
jgi:hypothetical protein